MKKLILAFILIFSLSFLCGCGQKTDLNIDKNFIMLSIEQNADGSSKQSVVFGVNSDFLRENLKNVQEELVFKQNLIKNVESLRYEFLFSFATVYINNPIEEYKINKGVLLSPVGYNADGDYVGFEITFTSAGAWQYYHQFGNNSASSGGKGNIFYSKKESVGSFPFVTVGEKYKNIYVSAAKELSFDSEISKSYMPDYVYNYSTYYSKFHSNADAEFRGNDNKYHHIWVENNLADCEQISLSVYVINKGWWILLTLLISLVGMIISIIYTKYKK